MIWSTGIFAHGGNPSRDLLTFAQRSRPFLRGLFAIWHLLHHHTPVAFHSGPLFRKMGPVLSGTFGGGGGRGGAGGAGAGSAGGGAGAGSAAGSSGSNSSAPTNSTTNPAGTTGFGLSCGVVSNGCCDVSAGQRRWLVAHQRHDADRSKSGKSKGASTGPG